MKLHIKNSAGAVATLIFLVFLVLAGSILLSPISPKPNKAETWKKYSSQGIGIEFEIPDYLQPFPLQEVSFKETESGPGFINVHTEFVGAKTVLEALETLEALKAIEAGSEKIVGKKTISGHEALITISNHPDSNPEDTRLYFVHDNLLYTISSRWIDRERFWNSIRFPH